MDDFFTEENINKPEALLASSGPAKKEKQPVDEEGQLTVDVYQTNDSIFIKSTVAGVNADDLDISVTDDMVTIRGSREHDQKIKEPDYYYRELYWGNFSRSIILPEDVDTDGARATLKDGILILELPKLSKLRTKKLKVSS